MGLNFSQTIFKEKELSKWILKLLESCIVEGERRHFFKLKIKQGNMTRIIFSESKLLTGGIDPSFTSEELTCLAEAPKLVP